MFKLKDLKKGFMNFWQDKKEPFEIPKSEIDKFSLGESIEKRPIDYYRVGSGPRKLLFMSAIHGNEIGTVKLAYFLLDYLRLNEKRYKNLTCFLVPCLNTGGFEKTKGIGRYFKVAKGRLNARNIDLNRNFPAPNFRSSSFVLPGESKTGTFKYKREISPDSSEAKNINLLHFKNCGEFGGSEPETKALIDFVEKEKISVIFSFHNSGRDVMGGKDELSKKIVKIYAEKTGYEILDDVEWRKIGQTGTMKDWCDDNNISFVEVEGSTRYGSDWEIQKPALEAVLEKLNASR